MPTLTYLQAIGAAQKEAMLEDLRVVIIGEDVRANMFGTTPGFVDLFGPDRIINAPISEAGFVGLAVGAAMTGLRPIVDLTYATFMYLAMDQLVNQASKNRYMFGGQADIPVVFRACMFYGASTAAHHSDRPYPMFMNVPGLKIALPASPIDAKGLLRTAVRIDDPVICFEDATLWLQREELPDEEFAIPFGEARIRQEGNDATLIAISGSVRHAVAAATAIKEEEGVSVDVIDPRTLVPLDRETILQSAARTGRVVVAEPGNRTCGAAAEISAIVSEECFESLRAPIRRVTTPDVPIPFSPALEKPLYPSQQSIDAALRATLGLAPART